MSAREVRMNTDLPRSVPVCGLMIGFLALLRALLLLDREPWIAALGLLAAMAVLLASIACLVREDERAESTDIENLETSRRR
jgi:hypothetical protein